MRILKVLLVLVFAAVTALYVFQNLSDEYSAAKEPPVFSCAGDTLEISVEDDESVLLSGVTAEDPQDGNLTDQVLVSGISKLISDSTAKVTYVVFDSHNNMATLTRYVQYTDYRLPRFSLEEPLIYGADEDIVLLDRLHARDVIDGDITGDIRVSYTEGTANPEIHTVDVQVTNSMGDTAWLTLPVIILSGEGDRVEVTLSDYLVYLDRGSAFRADSYLRRVSFSGQELNLDDVSISGQVDTGTPGTYMVQYTCAYGSRTGTAILTVVVE